VGTKGPPVKSRPILPGKELSSLDVKTTQKRHLICLKKKKLLNVIEED